MTQNDKNLKNNSKGKVFSSTKLKYGSSAVIFTAVFVAFIILINVLLSFVDVRSGGLYIDMTSKKLYGISEASVNALAGTDKQIEIIFCQPADKIAENDIINPVRMLAESYERQFSNVTVVYKDRLSDPVYFNSFMKTSADTITTDSIIVSCPTTGLSTIYGIADMYKFNTSGQLFAFDGENKLTTAMLSLARNDENMLKAGFVTGHGEGADHGVQHYLEDYGYSVSNIDLKTISKEALSEYDLVFVCNPVTDYIGMSKEEVTSELEDENLAGANVLNLNNAQAVNEIQKLYDYVVEDFGNIMFFFDPNGRNLPELFSLVSDGFGVNVDNLGYVIDADTVLKSSNIYDLSGVRFIGSYDMLDTTSAGYQIHKPISQAQTGYPPAFGVSCNIEIPKSSVGAFSISSVISGSQASVASVSGEAVGKPNAPLMTLSRYTKLVDSVEKKANVVVCGSTGFIDELDNPSFANADLFKQILITTGNDNIVADIDFKVLDESSVEATDAMVSDMMKKLGIVIPAIIAVVGVLVFIKRKYL